MPETTSPNELSAVKRALAEIRKLRARVDELEKGSAEPIAIVGLGLRLPGGATDEASFWDLLVDGRDVIGEVPLDRWDWHSYNDEERGSEATKVTRFGGFLDHPQDFDAGFFGISPREAVMMDPQHRLVLEIAWEALENAGYASSSLQGTDAGVFIGIGNSDYARHTMREPDAIDAYVGSGNAPAMVAGRLSYVLGTHGPSLAIDTSCSSSLVAVHEACVSLRTGECQMALAGGVNLMLLPEPHVALSRAQMMAPDGRCKVFDDAANGYVRSEGACVIVLKKLSSAVLDRDRIVGVIRGSAVNHDGRSGGLTAPSGPAQMAVIHKALEVARVQPADIGFVETHGTGTSLGDPIEVEALASVLCDGRDPRQPLLLGAVKSNLGHLEAASGIVGLVKAALVLRNQIVPPNLHLKTQNTRIPWKRLAVALPGECTPCKVHYAGVSSFGFSGTNAHVILEKPDESPADVNVRKRAWHVLAISAKSDASLAKLRSRYAAVLRNNEVSVSASCFTANTGRSHYEKRLAVVAQNAEEFIAGLEGVGSIRTFLGTADAEPGRICFLFTGQGSQYAGMGRELYESSVVYRSAVERCSEAWHSHTGESLIDALYVRGDELKTAGVIQPALFALEYGLAEMWRSWGIEPGVVLGHSLGEYVGCVVSGLLTLSDGLGLVHARAELMDKLTARGTMRAVATDAERVRGALEGLEREVSIAAINGAESVVISGSVDGVRLVAEKLERQGVRTRELEVSHGFHSPMLEPILDEFEQRAGKVAYGTARQRIVSNLTGRVAEAGEMSRPRYWRDHMRQTVQFHAGLQSALAIGCTTFIEIGPQPHLRAIAAKADAKLGDQIKASMVRNRSPFAQMCESVAQLYVEGQPVNWAGFDLGYSRSRVALPTYPFERKTYWHGTPSNDLAHNVWQQASQAAIAQAQFAPIGTHLETFPEKWESLKKLTVAQILTTLRELGAMPQAGEYDIHELIARSGIVAQHHRLMRRWFSLLESEGYLSQSPGRILVPSEISMPSLAAAWQDAEAHLQDDPYLLTWLKNCATLMRSVLQGQVNPLETLFPGGSEELAANVYSNSPGPRYANAIAAAAVQAGCATIPAGRKLRILEIGGGTGGFTASVLPKLPSRGVSYLFTDVSEQFLHRAAARFASYSCLLFGIVDVENEAHVRAHRSSCDILVAANVVHATRDIQTTLERVKELVVPGGTVILLETTQRAAWHEITVGLIEGWQKSDDAVRDGATLLQAAEWDSLLRRVGFVDVAQAPLSGSPAEDAGLHVLIAKAPASGADAPVHSGQPSELRWYPESASQIVDKNQGSAIAQRLKEVPAAERREIILDAVLEQVAQVLRLSAGDSVRKGDRLMEIGLDSLMALDLSGRLSKRMGLAEMPATLMFDYPTPSAIADYLLGRLGEDASGIDAAGPEEIVPVNTQRLSEEEVFELSDEAVAELLRSRLDK